jgi:cell division protein FtsB
VIVLGTAIIATYFLTTGGVNAIKGRQLSQQEHRLEQDIGDLQSRFNRLQALKDYLNSDEYIESVAREELGLVKRGEEGIVVISSAPAPTPAPNEGSPSLWWDVLIR